MAYVGRAARQAPSRATASVFGSPSARPPGAPVLGSAGPPPIGLELDIALPDDVRVVRDEGADGVRLAGREDRGEHDRDSDGDDRAGAEHPGAEASAGARGREPLSRRLPGPAHFR